MLSNTMKVLFASVKPVKQEIKKQADVFRYDPIKRHKMFILVYIRPAVQC